MNPALTRSDKSNFARGKPAKAHDLKAATVNPVGFAQCVGRRVGWIRGVDIIRHPLQHRFAPGAALDIAVAGFAHRHRPAREKCRCALSAPDPRRPAGRPATASRERASKHAPGTPPARQSRAGPGTGWQAGIGASDGGGLTVRSGLIAGGRSGRASSVGAVNGRLTNSASERNGPWALMASTTAAARRCTSAGLRRDNRASHRSHPR